MKSRKLTILSLTLLATLVLTIFVIEVFSPPKVKAKARFYPRTHTLDTPPATWNADLSFSPKRSADEIDASTIRLEGVAVELAAEPYDHLQKKSRVVVPFHGYDVLWIALLKAGHMAPGSANLIFLEVTGQLKDGRPFSTGMSGCIVIFVPELPPP